MVLSEYKGDVGRYVQQAQQGRNDGTVISSLELMVEKE